jgi:hypothetical protein
MFDDKCFITRKVLVIVDKVAYVSQPKPWDRD